MKYLIDTHILLWWFLNPKLLKKPTFERLRSLDNKILISSAVPWEIIIKRQIGKLKVPDRVFTLIEEQHIDVLPITFQHTLYLNKLPQIHKDPFDRIQIAQAKVEKIPFITNDNRIREYGEFVIQG